MRLKKKQLQGLYTCWEPCPWWAFTWQLIAGEKTSMTGLPQWISPENLQLLQECAHCHSSVDGTHHTASCGLQIPPGHYRSHSDSWQPAAPPLHLLSWCQQPVRGAGQWAVPVFCFSLHFSFPLFAVFSIPLQLEHFSCFINKEFSDIILLHLCFIFIWDIYQKESSPNPLLQQDGTRSNLSDGKPAILTMPAFHSFQKCFTALCYSRNLAWRSATRRVRTLVGASLCPSLN